MEIGAARLVFGRGAIEGTGVGDDGLRNGGASWRRGKAGDRRAEGAALGSGRVAEAKMDGAGFEAASQNRRPQGEAGGALEKRDGHDFGLDCTTFTDGLSAYGGKLFERIVAFYILQ